MTESPVAVVATTDAMSKAIGNSEVRERMAALGLEPAASTPEQFRSFLQSEVPKYSKILKDSGAKLD